MKKGEEQIFVEMKKLCPEKNPLGTPKTYTKEIMVSHFDSCQKDEFL